MIGCRSFVLAVMLGFPFLGCIPEVSQRPSSAAYVLVVEPEQLTFTVGEEQAVAFDARQGMQSLSMADLNVVSSNPTVVAPLNASSSEEQRILLSGRSVGTATILVSLKGETTIEDSFEVTVRDYDAIVAPRSDEDLLVGDTLSFVLVPTRLGQPSSWGPDTAITVTPEVEIDHDPFDPAQKSVVSATRNLEQGSMIEVKALVQGRATLTIKQGGVTTQWTVQVRAPAGIIVEPSVMESVAGGPPEDVTLHVLDESGEVLSRTLSEKVCPSSTVDATGSTWTSTGPTSWDVSGSAEKGREVAKLSCAPDSTRVWDAFIEIISDDGLDVQAALFHTCASRPTELGDGKDVVCFGSNAYGQLGTKPDLSPGVSDLQPQALPLTPPDSALIVQTSTKGEGQCSVMSDGRLFCVGRVGLPSGALMLDAMLQWSEIVHPDAKTWRQVQVDMSHACALDEARHLYCWGENNTGQLGNGSRVFAPEPVAVQGGMTWESVFLGGNRTCGVARDHRLWCWGSNAYDVLDPTQAVGGVQPTPQLIPFDDVVMSVSMGTAHMCTLNSQRQMRCWGTNSQGQLGQFEGPNGEPNYTLTVQPPDGASGWSILSVGDFTTCGVTTNNALYCWGSSENGLAGLEEEDGDPIPRAVVRSLELIKDSGVVTRLSVGVEHACLVNEVGVHCWGNLAHNRLDASTEGLVGEQTLELKKDGEQITFAALNDHYGCVLSEKTDGPPESGDGWIATNARCFGDNDLGRAGRSKTDRISTSPESVYSYSGPITFTQIDASFSHVCGVDDMSSGWCWGATLFCAQASCDDDGNILNNKEIREDGNFYNGYYSRTTQVPGNWASIYAGFYSGCGIRKEDNTVRCWGNNTFNQVTRQEDDIIERGQAVQPGPATLQHLENGQPQDWLQPVTHLAMGRVSACAIAQINPIFAQVYCWGDGLQGKDENGAFQKLEYVTPYGEIPGTVTQLSAGKDHFCAIVEGNDARSSVYCWGNGLYGQLNGERLGMMLPVKVGLSGANPIRIAAGERHSCAVVEPVDSALAKGRNVVCWGDNRYRQRGILRAGVSSEPALATITTPDDTSIVEDVFAGVRQTCLLARANAESAPNMYCWGALSHGQLGREATADVPKGLVTRAREISTF